MKDLSNSKNTCLCSTEAVMSWVSCSVGSDFLWPHGLQYARPPHPSPTPRACSNNWFPFGLFSSVQLLSHVWLFATSWTAARSGLPVHHQLPEFTQTHVHWVSVAIQPSHPLSSPSPPPSIFPSIRVFSNESALCIRWSNYWEFQFQHQFFQWTLRTDLH